MKQVESGWASDWSLRLRLWAERKGKAVLGPGRVELLQAIDRWRSISAAARQIGMSYRHAWLLVQSINEAAGKPVVESATGGKHGGGACLTAFGKQAVQVFHELQTEMQTAATQILPRVLQVEDRQARLHVSAAISLEEVLGQLLAEYALRQPAVRVRAVFGASNELADHILAGSPCDLFLSADAAQVAKLTRAGLAAARPPCLARNGLAVVVPGESKARPRRPADLLRPQFKRLAIADPDSPLGKYTHDYLSQLGLHEPLRDRMVTGDSSRAVLSVLHAGRADAAIVYSSDAATASGVRIVLSARAAAIGIAYRAAVLKTAHLGDEARAFLEFLTSSGAARTFRACGFLAPEKITRKAP